MKKKKLDHKKPMLFLQVGTREFEARIRIVYPNGFCETSYGERLYKTCWANKSKSPAEVLRKMKTYDRLCCFPKAIFCGYLE